MTRYIDHHKPVLAALWRITRIALGGDVDVNGGVFIWCAPCKQGLELPTVIV